MYVAEDVVLWLYPALYGVQQLHAAGPDTGAAQVTVSEGRAVC